MRPLKLTVEGLRSIRTAVEIDFTGRDNIAIIGDTGAGKSSLLQAITYALYGRPTYSGQANQELMNDTATQLRVVLEFVVAGERFKVARTLRRAGDGRVMPGVAVLARLGDDDTVLEQLEQVRPVNERIEALLGLNFDAFTRAVLLPQGEFAKLLVDDRPTARAATLQQIWRIDELTRLGEAARELSSELTPLLARVEQQLGGEPDDPQAHLATLVTARDTAASAAGQAADDHREAYEAAAALTTARNHHDTATSIAGALAADPPAAHVRDAAELAARADELASQRREARGEIDRVRAELAETPDEHDGLDASQVATARDRLGRLPALATDLDAAQAERCEWEEKADAARVAADEARAEAATRREQAQARARRRGELTDAKQAADTALRAATIALTDARHAKRTAADKHDEALQLRAKAETEAGEATAAADHAEQLVAPVTTLEAELEEHRRADAATAAAHGLHVGDACPVCERGLPDGWEPPSGSDTLEATVAALEHARAELTQARATAVRLRDKAAASADAADQARTAADKLAAAATDAKEALAGLLGVADDELALHTDDDAVLAPLTTRCLAADEAVSAYDAETTELDSRAAAAASTAETADNRAAELTERAHAAGSRAAKTLATMRELLAQLPEGLVELTLPHAADEAPLQLSDLGPARARLDQRDEVLAARAAARRELQQRLAQREQELAALEQQLESAVTTPARALAAKLDAYRDALAEATGQLRAADAAPEIMLPPLAAACEPAELPQLIKASSAANDTLLAAAGALKSAAAERGDAAREITDRLASLVGLPDGLEADELVRLLDERHRELDHAARTATRTAAAFERRVGPLVELERARGELAWVCALVNDLAQALQPSRFPKWLTLRRSRTLLVYASKLLGEMTGRRYAFADLDDEASEWRIIDADTGTPRSPQSLSGGEQFIASLALALGIVEMMARSGGRLESLWLDEGFGALDRTNLDLAVQALGSVSAGGRMVAVITHVQAVAEQVKHVLAVTRGPRGSSVEWLTAAQRLDAADGELTEEVAGVMSGLLH